MPDGLSYDGAAQRRQARLRRDSQLGQLTESRNAAASAKNKAINARNAQRTLRDGGTRIGNMSQETQERLISQASGLAVAKKAVAPAMQQFADVAEAQQRGISVPALSQERALGQARVDNQLAVNQTELARGSQIAGENSTRLAEGALDFQRDAFAAQTNADARRDVAGIDADARRDGFLSQKQIAELELDAERDIAGMEDSRIRGIVGGTPTTSPPARQSDFIQQPAPQTRGPAPQDPVALATSQVDQVMGLIADPNVSSHAVEKAVKNLGRDLLDARDTANDANDPILASRMTSNLNRLRQFALAQFNIDLFNGGVLR